MSWCQSIANFKKSAGMRVTASDHGGHSGAINRCYTAHMCSHFEPIQAQQTGWMHQHFGCSLPASDWRSNTFPTMLAPFIYVDAGKPVCQLARFGLVPRWAAQQAKFGLHTYNARSETVAEKPAYRAAWRARRFGLLPAQCFYEPCYETGRAVDTAISRIDQTPTAIAAIWERMLDPVSGQSLLSFSMLTVNADHHPLMQRFHKPLEEKRSVVVIEPADFWPWLNAQSNDASRWLNVPQSGALTAEFPVDPYALF